MTERTEMPESRGDAVPIERGAPPKPSGRIYQPHAVAFLDLLGARARRSDETFLNGLAVAVASESRDRQLWSKASSIGFRSIWFSDNIGISMPLAGDSYAPHGDLSQSQWAIYAVAWYAADLQAHLLAELGLLARGVVVVGDHYHDDHMIFGPALVEAYELESQRVNWPRLALSSDAADEVMGTDLPLVPDQDMVTVDSMAVGAPIGARERHAYYERLQRNISAGVANAARGSRPRELWSWTADQFNRQKPDNLADVEC